MSWPRSYPDLGALFPPIAGDEVPTLNNDILISPTAYSASCPSNHLIRSSSIHDGDFAPAQLAKRFAGQPEELAAVKTHRAAHARITGQELQNRA